MLKKDYCQILGVACDASWQEIKAAYIRLIWIHHPDAHGQQDNPIIRLINEAYAILGKQKRRSSNNQLNFTKVKNQYYPKPDTTGLLINVFA